MRFSDNSPYTITLMMMLIDTTIMVAIIGALANLTAAMQGAKFYSTVGEQCREPVTYKSTKKELYA